MTHWKWGLATILLLVGALLAPLLMRERTDPSLRDLPGFAVYEQRCVRCHGSRGAGKKASALAGRPLDLASPAFRDTATAEGIREIITRGKGKMEGLGEKLSAQDAEAVASFVLLLPLRSPSEGAR